MTLLTGTVTAGLFTHKTQIGNADFPAIFLSLIDKFRDADYHLWIITRRVSWPLPWSGAVLRVNDGQHSVIADNCSLADKPPAALFIEFDKEFRATGISSVRILPGPMMAT
jgi:hypothetical protein